MIADRTLRGKLENSPIAESFRVLWDYVTDVDWYLAAKPMYWKVSRAHLTLEDLRKTRTTFDFSFQQTSADRNNFLLQALEMFTTAPCFNARLYGQNFNDEQMCEQNPEVGKETRAYSMTSLQQFIVNTLNFNVNRDPKSFQALRVTQRHTGMNDGFFSHFALSQVTCYELDGAEEAP